MSRKKNNNKVQLLHTILDLGEFLLQVTTMGGAAFLTGWAVWLVLNGSQLAALLTVLVAAMLLAINVLMRTTVTPKTRRGKN